MSLLIPGFSVVFGLEPASGTTPTDPTFHTDAPDLLAALKLLFYSSEPLKAAIPGGWHVNEGAVEATFPYVTARQYAGPLGRRSSSSNIDDVRVRMRFWGNKLSIARSAADVLEGVFLDAGGITWANGWATPLERVDRIEDKGAGRAPGNAGVLRLVDVVFLTHCGRGV